MKFRKGPLLIAFVMVFLSACGQASSPEASQASTNPTAENPRFTPLPTFSMNSIRPGEQQAHSFVSTSGDDIRYLLYFPDEYDGSKKWPLILSLHGLIGNGTHIDGLRKHTLPEFWTSERSFPFLVVSPQISSGYWFQQFDALDELIQNLSGRLPIDENAVFLTGYSAGAFGTWRYAMRDPDKFAAIVPVAGGASTLPSSPVPEDICVLKNTPAWVVYSEKDEWTPFESVVAVIEAVEACGNNMLLVESYSDLGHEETWLAAYSDPSLYEWMLEQVEE